MRGAVVAASGVVLTGAAQWNPPKTSNHNPEESLAVDIDSVLYANLGLVAMAS